MTKRAAEKTLRDEVAVAQRDYKRADDDYDRARTRLGEAEDAVAKAWSLVAEARARLERTRDALETLSGVRLELNLPTTYDQVGAPEEGTPVPILVETVSREVAIAEATGVDVETVRKASKRGRADEELAP